MAAFFLLSSTFLFLCLINDGPSNSAGMTADMAGTFQGPGTRANSTAYGILRGTVVTLHGEKMSSAVVIITKLNDTDTTPIPSITVDMNTSQYYREFNVSGRFQASAMATAFQNSAVHTVEISPGKTVWLNFTLIPYESLTGYVFGEDGRPIDGAAIKINQPGKNELMIKTPETGQYKAFISSGTLNITVSKIGYRSDTRTLLISPGERRGLNITLQKNGTASDGKNNALLYAFAIVGAVLLITVVAVIIFIKTRKKKDAPKKEDSITEMECPKCGAVVKPDATKCPECGERFKVRCPECGKEYKEHVPKCKQCGHVFTSSSKRDQVQD